MENIENGAINIIRLAFFEGMGYSDMHYCGRYGTIISNETVEYNLSVEIFYYYVWCRRYKPL